MIRAKIENAPNGVKHTDKKSDTSPLYLFSERIRNPKYEAGLVCLPTQRNNQRKLNASKVAIKEPNAVAEILMRSAIEKNVSERASLCSCLLHNKSDVFKPNYLVIETTPKWRDYYKTLGLDLRNGFFENGTYESNSHRAANNRKIKALNEFCDYYQPLYSRRSVTLFMFTLTGFWTHTEMEVKDLIEVLKARFKRRGAKMLGYIWTFEISPELHPHYHLAVAVERMNLKGKTLPKYLFLNKVWGARTQVDFVKKNIKHYLSKYFAKNNFRALNKRSYGTSAKYDYPKYAA